MSNWDALGPAYAKLGIATSPEIITARKAAAAAGYKAYKAIHLSGIIRGALGLGVDANAKLLLDLMRSDDPTLDVEPGDLEVGVLFGSILSFEMKQKSYLGGLSALGIVASSFGGLRQSPTNPGLVREADEALASMQLYVGSKPAALVAPTMPDDLTAALAALTVSNTGYGQNLAPVPAMAAIRSIAEHSVAGQAAAALQVNAAVEYTRKLEEELRTYWWVVGGWSDGQKTAFRSMKQSTAAIYAGIELAAKTTLPLGLFAAPALLDRVLREDRKGRPQKPALSEAVAELGSGLGGRFQPAIALNANLLPVSAAIQIASESDPDEDWRPRFRRTTQVSGDPKMGPLELALQIYREVLFAKALPRSKS